MRRCSVCGRRDADILCARCGGIICDSCYDDETDTCIACSGKKPMNASNLNRPAILVTGLMLIFLGLMITSWAFIPQDVATVVFFPFMFSGFNGAAVILMSLAFAAFYGLSSLLPLYILLRRSEYTDWEEGVYTLQDSLITGGSTIGSLEYMITTEIPGGLKDTIYMEEEENSIMVMSSKDSNFIKTYKLPEEYHVDEIESEFDGNFLVVRVHLKKVL